MPIVESDRRMNLGSLPSTIDDHFANVQVELQAKPIDIPL